MKAQKQCLQLWFVECNYNCSLVWCISRAHSLQLSTLFLVCFLHRPLTTPNCIMIGYTVKKLPKQVKITLVVYCINSVLFLIGSINYGLIGNVISQRFYGIYFRTHNGEKHRVGIFEPCSCRVVSFASKMMEGDLILICSGFLAQASLPVYKVNWAFICSRKQNVNQQPGVKNWEDL